VMKLGGGNPTPDVQSLEPAPTGDGTVIFSVGVSHVYGYDAVSIVYLLISNGRDYASACMASYEVATGALRLASDDGVTWMAPVATGRDPCCKTPSAVCVLGFSSVSASGNILSVKFHRVQAGLPGAEADRYSGSGYRR
jgi:hypothetical protein